MKAWAVIGGLLGLAIALAPTGLMQAKSREGPAPAAKATALQLMPDQKARGEAVARLVEQLKRHPVEPKAAADRAAIYLMDLANGEVTLIADQPAPGITQCGSPTWSITAAVSL